VVFSVVTGAGSGGDALAWTGLPTGCPTSTTDEVTCTVSAAGSFSVQAQITDSNQYTATSGALALTIYADPTAQLTASLSNFDVGQSVTLTATGSLGSGDYTYAWSGLPTGCEPTEAVLTCAPTAPGNSSVQVKITDSNGEVASSSVVALVVAAPLSATLSASLTSATTGQTVSFSSSATGGTGALSYAWEFGDGSTATGTTVIHSYQNAGSYTVTLWVNDSSGASVQKTVAVTVTGPAGSTSTSGSSVSGIELAAAAIVILAAIALAALLLLRARTGKGGSSDERTEGSSSTPPSPETPSDTGEDAAPSSPPEEASSESP